VSAGTGDLLATIVAATRRTTEVRAFREPLPQLRARVERTIGDEEKPRASFIDALSRRDRLNVIAECKRRSPSKGVLRKDYDAVTIATGYAAAGAAAISVLTEPTFFDGSLDDLAAVHAAVDIPLLRKDFIVSEYQVLEARAAGASAMLLIVAALTPAELRTLSARAASLGLDVLVEVHNEEELAVASDAGSRIIGVNNRNLRTLEVDVNASETLIRKMPEGVLAVSESGLRTADDLARLRGLGYQAFLVGERFMTTVDPGSALKELLAGAPCL
jgi:indole-3-glycerol phosphate synthase